MSAAVSLAAARSTSAGEPVRKIWEKKYGNAWLRRSLLPVLHYWGSILLLFGRHRHGSQKN